MKKIWILQKGRENIYVIICFIIKYCLKNTLDFRPRQNDWEWVYHPICSRVLQRNRTSCVCVYVKRLFIIRNYLIWLWRLGNPKIVEIQKIWWYRFLLETSGLRPKKSHCSNSHSKAGKDWCFSSQSRQQEFPLSLCYSKKLFELDPPIMGGNLLYLVY
jgi:hypothetical protein